MIFLQPYVAHFLWISTGMDANNLAVNIGLSNGLVPPGNKPLSDPLLANMFFATWRP